MKSRLFYFAYGRDMDPECMKRHFRHATAVCPATLRNYRLTERRYADIDPDPASEVYGVLYRITPEDRKNLNCHFEFLSSFAVIEVDVVFGDKTFKALTYIMTEKAKRRCDGIPYQYEYIRDCRRGASHYMVPDSFRYANFIVYGPWLEEDDEENEYCKNAVAIRPCTITGTLYDSGYNCPVFSPEGNTPVEATLLRIPRSILEERMEELLSSPFRMQFLVAALPDGSTVGGWATCIDRLPPRAKVIESGCWEKTPELKYDSLLFLFHGGGVNTHMVISLKENFILGELNGLSPDEREEDEGEKKGCCFGKYWKRELVAAFRDCHFERWPKRYYSNGVSEPKWQIELLKEDETVRVMKGYNVFPPNWNVLKNVVRLCFRLCREETSLQEKDAEQGSSADKTELPDSRHEAQTASAGTVPRQDIACNKQKIPVPVQAQKLQAQYVSARTGIRQDTDLTAAVSGTETVAARSKSRTKPVNDDQPELPFFDSGSSASASAPMFSSPGSDSSSGRDTTADNAADSTPAPPSDDDDDDLPGPDDVESWFIIMYNGFIELLEDERCPVDKLSLEQWKELTLQWPDISLYRKPPAEVLKIMTKNDFVAWSGEDICRALFSDGDWLAEVVPTERIRQEDFDRWFAMKYFDSPEEYRDAIRKCFPHGIPERIELSDPVPDDLYSDRPDKDGRKKE